MSKEYTAATFATAIGVEKEDAYNFLRFLVSQGFAENLGAKQTAGKKGRGESHYAIKATAPDAVKKLLEVSLGLCKL